MKHKLNEYFSIKSVRFCIGVLLASAFLFIFYQRGAVRNGLILFVLIILSGTISFQNCRINKKLSAAVWMAVFLISSLITAFISQLILNQKLFSLGLRNVILEVLIVYIFMSFFCAVSNKKRLSIVTAAVLASVFTAIDYFVYSFRGAEITPLDLLSIKTALEVSGNYSYTIRITMLYAFSLLIVLCLSVFSLPEESEKAPVKSRIWFTGNTLAACLVTGLLLSHVNTFHFDLEGSAKNGYLVNLK